MAQFFGRDRGCCCQDNLNPVENVAVDEQNVESGEEISIPIPRRDEDVEGLLGELEDDRQTVEETDIEELEAEIDRVVYDLFDLIENERDVIKDYLEVY